jgi:hypothetical protein
VKPERLLVPLAAIAIAVFATSRLMVAIDPGEAHPTGLTKKTIGDLQSELRNAGKPGAAERLRRELERGAGAGMRERDGTPRGETYSFYSPKGMRQLKSLMEAEGGRGGRVALFRIQSSQAQIQVGRGGRQGGAILVVDRGPSVRFRTPTPVLGAGGFSPAGLDPRAPGRIGRAIARQSEASPADVDYMVFFVNPIDHEGSWDAFLTRTATHFHADAHGRHVTQP